jgi:hypothetical protein
MNPKLAAAIDIAAKGHALDQRKHDGLPYVNHIIEVLNIMIYGEVTDSDVLIAAVLHDVLEDTDISRHEIKHRFGSDVLALVDEVTEDKSLTHEKRKAGAIATIESASAAALNIKLADLISNMSAIPPWNEERIASYLQHCERVLNAISGSSSWVSYRLLELAKFYLQAQKVGCEFYSCLSDLAFSGELFWSNSFESFITVDDIAPSSKRYYVVLSLNNTAFKLGLLRNLRIADATESRLTLYGDYDPSSGKKELFVKPMECDCALVNYEVAPDNRAKT